jgi:hypothetical protein
MSRTEVEFLAYCPDYCLKSFTIGIGVARAGRAPQPENVAQARAGRKKSSAGLIEA